LRTHTRKIVTECCPPKYLKEIDRSSREYQPVLALVFQSALDVGHISEKMLSVKYEEVEQLCSIMEKKLVAGGLTQIQKVILIDYIEKLQLARDVLAVKLGYVELPNIKKAAKHLGKMMQSSFSE
jgi:hypothetical protein